MNTHPKEFKDSVWASGDRKPTHDEPKDAIYEDKYPKERTLVVYSRVKTYPSNDWIMLLKKHTPKELKWPTKEKLQVLI